MSTKFKEKILDSPKADSHFQEKLELHTHFNLLMKTNLQELPLGFQWIWASGIMFPILFMSLGFSFPNIQESHDSTGKGGHFFNSSLPLPPVSQTLRH